MSKRKNKPNKLEQQKLALAQYRNKFLSNLRHLGALILGEKDIDTILSKEKADLFNVRVPLLKVVPAPGCKITPARLKEAKFYLSHALNTKKLSLWKDGPEISLHDYYSEGMTLFLYLGRLKEEDFPGAVAIKEKFESRVDFDKIHNEAVADISNAFMAAGAMMSNLSKEIYWGHHKIKIVKSEDPHWINQIELHCKVPEKINVTIDGIPRQAVRACSAFGHTGILYASIPPEKLNISIRINPEPLDVYIQNHALIRITERIDCVEIGFTYMMMYDSLMNPIAIRDKAGNIMIEFRFYDTKVGYLLSDIVDGKIVIRTFLFLTNDGTPEAEKLKKVTGLSKKDIEYLSIHKLSSFINSDISTNEQTRNLFSESGCNSLIELHDALKRISIEGKEINAADKIIKYLNLARPENNLPQVYTDSLGIDDLSG